MKKALLLVLVAFTAALIGCSSMEQYSTAQSNIRNGEKMLDNGNYKQALEQFLNAARATPKDPYPYALAASASYKLNDIDAAWGYIQDAIRLNKGSDSYVRIMGYKALILLRQGKQKEGMDALNDYIQAYEKQYAPRNVREIKAMWRSNRIDLPVMEQQIDQDILTFENDMEQLRTSGTGWFGAKYGPGSGGGR